MTINTKDIEALVDEQCSSIHPIELNRLLKKLDHEDLHVLKDMLEECYEFGKTDAEKVNDRYEEGYSDGYNAGLSEGE